MRFKPPAFLVNWIPDLVWDISRRVAPDGDCGSAPGEDVFLTFDDGPTPGVTEWILDEMARYGAKGTFFCLGRNAELHPALVQRILAEGHCVGNHTYNHLKGWGTDVERYVEDVDKAREVIGGTLFRPPYGRVLPVQARALGGRYTIVMWNIISRDYNRRLSPRACLDNVIRHVRPGDIVVFHDSEKASRNMRYALHGTLEYLSAMGMKSKAIEI